jgi:hypothetical protein
MPIVHSDRVSGEIFILAESAEDAGDKALKYLQNKDFDHRMSYSVFDDRKGAERELHDNRSSYDPARTRVYSFQLNIQVAD